MRMKDKVALVTGGASGLGAATAVRLAEEGAKVCVCDLDEVGGQKTVAQIGEAGGDAFFFKSDVSTAEGAEACVAAAVERFGALHVLFNNAGISGAYRAGQSNLDSMEPEEFDKVIAVNLRGVFLVAKYAARAMREAGGGAIVNTASIAGLVGMANPGYSGSKGGVHVMTKMMALELAKDNIRVNAVAPGSSTPRCSAAYTGGPTRRRSRNRWSATHRSPPSDGTGNPPTSPTPSSISPPTRPPSLPATAWSSTAGSPPSRDLCVTRPRAQAWVGPGGLASSPNGDLCKTPSRERAPP